MSGSRRPPLAPAVVALGAASFFTDVGSEMIYPLLPAFLAALGGSPVFLGLVEGVADAVSSLLKLASGYVADRPAHRKPLVVLGYGLASVARPLVGLASVPMHVLLVRVTDRIGKGIRTSPRDAMIAAAARHGEVGRAFGFQRALDHAGAVVGPLIAWAMLAQGVELRHVFFAALLPGLLSVACVLSVRDAPNRAAVQSSAPLGRREPLSPAFKRYLLTLAVFSMGTASDAFLLLRARELGVPVELIPILWSSCHVAKVASSFAGGVLTDRTPPAYLIASGWMVYALVCIGLASASGTLQVWLLFMIYGTYAGLTEPAERALVTGLAPSSAHGRAFGHYNFVLGASAIPAGLLIGTLWQSFGPRTALFLSAVLAFTAAIVLLLQAQLPRAQPTSGDEHDA